MWICYCTRMQRYKKVCSAIKNSKYKLQAHEQGGALEHILLDPYNTWFYLQYTKPQLHERIRFLKSKIKQYSDDTMMKILEEGSELFPCILYKDVFTFVKNCTTAYYVSSTNYVKIKRNGNQWELHNLKTYEEPQKAFDLEMFRSNLIQLSVMCCNSPVNNTSLNLEFLNQSMDTTSMYDNAMIID